jgi:ABC-type glycerol-3-phosphate transport system substrate-binding protein
VARPTTPYFTQIQNDLVDAVQSVLLGQQTAEKAMKQLNQQANNTLQ